MNEAINNLIQKCKLCSLHTYVDYKVISSGTDKARYIVIGQSPGREEYLCKTPFIGPAGILLREALKIAGFNINDIFFTNALRCWPHVGSSEGDSRNITPCDNEIALCRNYVLMEIDYIKPECIIALGNDAMKVFHGSYEGITKKHGMPEIYSLNESDYSVVPTYHPSYLLRCRGQKKYETLYREFIEDLVLARNTISKIGV